MPPRRCCRCRVRWRQRSSACWTASSICPASRQQCWRPFLQRQQAAAWQQQPEAGRMRAVQTGERWRPLGVPSARLRRPASALGNAQIVGALLPLALAACCCRLGGPPVLPFMVLCDDGKSVAAQKRNADAWGMASLQHTRSSPVCTLNFHIHIANYRRSRHRWRDKLAARVAHITNGCWWLSGSSWPILNRASHTD